MRVLLSDLEGATVQRVSAVGSNFVPRPDVVVIVAEVLEGLRTCGAEILPGVSGFTEGWGAAGRKLVREIVALGGTTIPGGAALPQGTVDLQEVQLVQRELRDFVLSPVDRNLRDCLVECKRSYWDGYCKTFWTPHYKERGEQEPEILVRWCAIAVELGWTVLGPLPPVIRQKVAGNSYTLAKMKDLDPLSPHAADPRRRPLTPYGGRGKQGHPLARYMKMAGAVLQRALKDGELTCWHLSSVQAFADGLRDDYAKLSTVGAADGQTRIFPFDVKSMFTELDKAAVLEHVTWLVMENSGWRRAQTAAGKGSRYPRGAYVSKVGPCYSARVGSGLGQRAGETYISLKMVL